MTNPYLISIPFSDAGDKQDILDSAPLDPNDPTWVAGFPEVTSTPISEGGLPPKRISFNGVLNAVTQNIVHQSKGLMYEFDSAYSSKIGGYPLNSRLALSNGDVVKSTIPSNSNDPNMNMTGWVKTNDASQIFDASGKSQQEINNNTKFDNGTGSGKNITVFPEYNAIASGLNASTISGGGNTTYRNMIGYYEPLDIFVGDSSTRIFTTSYDTSSATDVTVRLVRADGVMFDITAYCNRMYIGGKTVITYPMDGHFVNDAPGGAEGTNPALLTNQKLRVNRRTKVEMIGSQSDYCGIWGGYDNIQFGIMNHQMGAHHRITGGNHNTQIGGSYHTILAGNYGGIFAGSNNTINDTAGTSSIIAGGGNNTLTGASSFSIGGYGTTVSGARSGSLGAYNSTNSGVDSLIAGNGVTNTAAKGYVFGETLNNSGAYSVIYGLNNINSGYYSLLLGRENSNTKDYSVVSGRGAIGRNGGARVYAPAKISNNGDAQVTSLPMKAQTTSAISVYASTAAIEQTINIGDVSNNLVTVQAVASDVATGNSSSFELKFHVKRNAGVTAIMGTPTATKIYNDSSAALWNILPNVSPTLSMFRISCVGEAGKTINWSLNVEIVELGY